MQSTTAKWRAWGGLREGAYLAARRRCDKAHSHRRLQARTNALFDNAGDSFGLSVFAGTLLWLAHDCR
jgi:hypothetical protein